MTVDAHIHLRQLFKFDRSIEHIINSDYSAICSCHCDEDLSTAFNISDICNTSLKKIFISYGTHPFEPEKEELEKINCLAENKKIDAIGEAGLDRFSKPLSEKIDAQKKVFSAQIEIAAKHSIPIILHIRKAVEELFSFSKELSKVPAVIFHCYSGSFQEAEHLLKRNINAYFSFGTPLINGNIKAAETLKKIPTERVLVETDAPYQPLKGESYTKITDIEKILVAASEIKKIETHLLRDLIYINFQNIFDKRQSMNTNLRIVPEKNGEKNES